MAEARGVTDKAGKLTARADQFCREYIIDFVGAAAAIRAGVPEKGARVWACRSLAMEPIQARVAELMAERAQRTGVTADWVVNGIADVARRCSKQDTFDAAGANRAYELLGRHLGIFEKDNAQRTPRLEAERLAAIDAEIEEMMNRGHAGNGAATRH